MSDVLHRPGDTVVHLLPPQVKIVCAFLAVVAVVATPRTAFWAFGAHLLVLAVVWVLARIPPGWLARRAVLEAPFVVLALVLPFTGGDPHTGFLGLSLSVDGLYGGWNILAKGTLGVLVSLTLAATTHPSELIDGLRTLRVPAVLTTIATLMLRYVELLVAEARRMLLARLSRGHDPRFLWQAAALARGIGVLFLRAYERGERVHVAMLARGWSGGSPPPAPSPDPPGLPGWLAGVAPALVVSTVCGLARWLT